MILSRAAYVRIIGGFRIIRKFVNAKHRTIILPNLYIRLFQRKILMEVYPSIRKIFHRLYQQSSRVYVLKYNTFSRNEMNYLEAHNHDDRFLQVSKHRYTN